MKHLDDNNLTYFAHMSRSFGFAWACKKAALAAIIHGLLPMVYETKARDIIKDKRTEMFDRDDT